MNILVIGACPYPSGLGSQVYLRATAAALASRGHRVRIAVYGWGESPEFPGRAAALDQASQPAIPDPPHPENTALARARLWGRVPQRVTSGPNRRKVLDDLALWRLLRRLRRAEPPDAVCAHNHEALALAVAAGFKNIVYFAHNALAEELPWYVSGEERKRQAAARIGQLVDAFLPGRASMVIAPHHRLAGYLVLRGCPRERIGILPPPADPALLDLPLLPPSRMQPCPPVVYMGNLDAYQNTDLLLRAVTRARELRPNLRLTVISRDPAVIPGAEIIPDQGMDTLARVLSDDVIVAIPRAGWSGFPIKLVNALAAGKPIVTTDASAWGLAHDQNALIVPAGDERVFSEALVRLVDRAELRSRLGKNARATALERHHPGLYAQQLESLIISAATGKEN
ncbi:MAG TPA: glycosyltransferase family 4 protein [Candidatus Hydrogenedentes bacterium]|nr:glycosyltransferase family 4 protein [Candidatus Hydrogenedentota bacterium]